MRKLQRTRLIVLVITVVVLAFVVDWIHDRQAAKSVRHLFDMAERARKKDDLIGALRYYDLYAVKRPQELDVRLVAAEVALDPRFLGTVEGIERAIDKIENVLRLDPSRQDLRLRLVRLALEHGLEGVSRPHLVVLEQQRPEDGTVSFYKGWLEERSGRFSRAADAYENARRRSPNGIEGYNRLARLYRTRLNERDKADRVMDLPQPADGLIRNNPRNAKAYLTRAIYRRDFQLPNPDEDIRKALELSPDDFDVLVSAARESFLQGKPDDARKHLAKARELYPDNPRVYLSQAAVETRSSRFDDAVRLLREGRDHIPDDMELQWNLADLLVQLNRADEAEPEIVRLRKMGARREVLDFLSGLTSVARQQWSDAAPKLELSAKELASNSDTLVLARRAYLGLGRCYSELGNTDLQLSSYNRALQIDASIDDRQTIQARSGAAAALVDMGRLDEAIEEYRKNLILPNAPADTKIILARLLIFRNLRMLETYRRWDEIEQLLDNAAKSMPDTSEVVILQAETLAAQAKLDPARQLLEKALEVHPDRPDLYVALSILAQRQEQPQEAFRILDQGEAKLGDKLDFRLARARLWGTQGGPRASEELAKLEKGMEKFPYAQRRKLVGGIAQSYTQIGDLKTALGFWKRMGAEQPRDLTPRLIQFDMAMLDGQNDEIDRIIGEIQAIEGTEGSIWRYARARVLMNEFRQSGDRNLLVQARDLLNLVAQRRPAWSCPPLAQGEIDDLLNSPNVALRGYQQAIRLGDRSPLAIRRSIQILYQQRRFDQADQILRQLQEQLPISGELQRLAADISLQQRDYARALTLAKKAVSTESPDYKDHIWLGQVLWIIAERAAKEGKGQESRTLRADAEEQLRRAVELGHDKPEPWVALIQFLVLIDQKAAAERAFTEAEKAIPPADAPLALAQASEALGETERTEKLYLQALDLKPDDTVAIQALATHYIRNNRMQEAGAHLTKLIELRAQSPDEARWATRILSQVLASQGTYRQSLRALEMLGLSDGSALDDSSTDAQPIEDLRAKVYVLARQKNLARLREAKRLLEQILRRESPVPYDVFLHGHLCELEGDWSKAREQFRNAVAMVPNEAMFIIELANALIRHDLPDDARVWLDRLESLKPGSLETIEIRARLLAAKKQGEQAARIVLDYVKDKEIPVRYCAELLETLGQFDAAEQLFRRFAAQSDHPENVLYLSAFLGRRQLTDEALNICDAAWATCKPEDVAAAAVQNIYYAPSPEKHYDRVAAKLEEMIAKHPLNVALTFELANIRALQGQVDLASRIYLDTFKKNSNNVAPLNNLAWMLAFQPRGGKQALDSINQAIADYTAVPALLDTRGVVYMALGEPELAIRDFEEAITVEPNPGRQLHLAEAYLMAKRKRDSQDAFNEAKRLGLDPRSLHPFERKPYQDLLAKLAEK
jgi:tetratricopeptide (TPR) repeat protein